MKKKTEVRVQFKKPQNGLYDDVQANELVVRIQPGEAVFLKMSTKKPGLTNEATYVELDLSYEDRFMLKEALPDAYEKLLLDVIRGDHNLFVRNDELREAWKIFTPVLHKLEGEKIKPIIYQFGTRGPEEADAMLEKAGYTRPEGYSWRKK